MGLLKNLTSLFRGMDEFFEMLREMFSCLPIVVQVLIFFAFGGYLLLGLVKMLYHA